MANPLTGVLVDVCNGTIEKKTLDGTLQGFYRALHCDCIDITTRSIAGRIFDFVCDDEGLLKPGAKISAIDSKRNPMLVGNLFICSSDEEGNSVSIDDEAIAHIKDNVLGCISGLSFYGVIGNVEYC